MNKRTHFILGFLSGAVIFGAVTAFALEVIPNPFPIKLDGKSVNIEGYNIDGKSYFQLRDIGNAVGFTVDWDAENNTVVMETEASASVVPSPSAAPIANSGDKPAMTTDGLEITYYDGVGYVTKGLIQQKLKSVGFENYTFRTDYIGDDNSTAGEPVFSNIPVYSENKQYIPVDFYYSDLLPWIQSLNK